MFGFKDQGTGLKSGNDCGVTSHTQLHSSFFPTPFLTFFFSFQWAVMLCLCLAALMTPTWREGDYPSKAPSCTCGVISCNEKPEGGTGQSQWAVLWSESEPDAHVSWLIISHLDRLFWLQMLSGCPTVQKKQHDPRATCKSRQRVITNITGCESALLTHKFYSFGKYQSEPRSWMTWRRCSTCWVIATLYHAERSLYCICVQQPAAPRPTPPVPRQHDLTRKD